MKKILIALVVALSLVSNLCFGDCNWSTGITPGPNKAFEYTEACHLAVGALVRDAKVQTDQILDYKKALALKDQALAISDQRVQLWSDTSSKLEERVTKLDQMQKTNEIWFFALGALTMLGAGFMAAKLIGH